jgi:hypothetical protein
MRFALSLSLLLAVAISPPVRAEQIRRIDTCFEESLAALRLSQLESGISHCDQVIEDKAAPSERRGQAFAQRGLMYARRWSIMSTPTFATQGAADITEALQLHTPGIERKHHLLLIRGQLYAATGQTRRASSDFSTILSEDPRNTAAQNGLKQLGSPAGL